MPILLCFYSLSAKNKISFFIKNMHFSASNFTWGQNNLFYRIQRPLKPLFSNPTRFFIFFEKYRFCVFFAISILAITFFAHSGFLRILDMLFNVTWCIIDVHFSTIFFSIKRSFFGYFYPSFMKQAVGMQDTAYKSR